MNRKLQVSVFNTQPPHLYYGGVERRILEIAKRLSNKINTIVYSGTKNNFKKITRINEMTFIPSFSTDKFFPLDNWVFNRSLVRTVDVEKTDAFEAHTVSGYEFLRYLKKNRIIETIVIVCKILDEFISLASRLIVLNKDGSIFCDGIPREILKNKGSFLLQELGVYIPQVSELELNLPPHVRSKQFPIMVEDSFNNLRKRSISYQVTSLLKNNGKEYSKDVIVLPNHVIQGKWRKKRHKINEEILTNILEQEKKIEMVIFGTGNYGLIKITSQIEEILKLRGIAYLFVSTKKAVKIFNEKTKSGKKKIIGFFHLNC